MKRFYFACALLLFFLGSVCTVLAHSYQQGAIRIGHVWARATPSGATTAAVYMPLLNTGDQADIFIGASSPLADKIEVHDMSHEDGVMKMKSMDNVDLEPGKPVTFRPGGKHLMLV